MAKAKIKVTFEIVEDEDKAIKESINKKFTAKIIEYPTVPRIGEWVDVLKLSEDYNFSKEELQWLSAKEHKYRIESVNMCEGYIEAELDMDKVWQEEA